MCEQLVNASLAVICGDLQDRFLVTMEPHCAIKPVSNLNKDSLDFFSGPATTAHAVMQLNAEDGGNLFINNVKEGRTDLDLLFGCMLDWGVQLSLPLAKQEVDNCDVYVVNEGDMVACFSEKLSEKVIDAIAELMPVRVVFRDSCFAVASSKMNLFELFKQKCGWSEEEARNNIRVI